MTKEFKEPYDESISPTAKCNQSDFNAPLIQALYKEFDFQLPQQKLILDVFSTPNLIAEQSPSDRVTAALQVLLEFIAAETSQVDRLDKSLLDFFIAKIDYALNEQLDVIMHHPQFQQLESLWTSLKYLVDRTDFKANIKIELLDVTKEQLFDNFSDNSDITQAGLYKHIYVDEFDTPGGEPFSAMITAFEFNSNEEDIRLLNNLAKVAAVTHCPIIGSVGPQFFLKNNFSEVLAIEDLTSYMDRAEFIKWNSFRDCEDARYIGLTLPKMLMRLPYGDNNSVRSFQYFENVYAPPNVFVSKNQNIDRRPSRYLWGHSSFAFAVNMVRSFKYHGWTVNIRGPESGGKVENLLLHQYEYCRGLQTKIPTEILIPETAELELATLGFIPLSYYKNSDYACFFSANSVQKPTIYSADHATANSRINARMPYVFLSSRLGHYLKVLQRENIGSNKDRDELERELNLWLQTLITKMNNPGPELIAQHPLRDGRVEVLTIPDNPGYFRVNLYAIPHFQVEGLDVQLSLVSQMPTGDSANLKK